MSLFLVALCIVGGDEAAPVVLELFAGSSGRQVQWIQPDFGSGRLGLLGVFTRQNLVGVAVLEVPESTLGLRLSGNVRSWYFYV